MTKPKQLERLEKRLARMAGDHFITCRIHAKEKFQGAGTIGAVYKHWVGKAKMEIPARTSARLHCAPFVPISLRHFGSRW